MGYSGWPVSTGIAGGTWAAREVALRRTVAWTALRLAALSVLLVAPWAVHLGRSVLTSIGRGLDSLAAPPDLATSVPHWLFATGHTEWVLAIAGAGLGLALLRRRWRFVLVGLWTGLCLIVSDPGLLGLRGSWFVHGTSAGISYWLPAGLLIGYLVGESWLGLAGIFRRRGYRPALRAIQVLLPCALAFTAIYAIWDQADVINASTVLVEASDLPAIEWAAQHLPEDSLVLINTEPWQPGTPMGSDAGWWLPYLADRQVTYPSVLYTQGTPAYRAEVLALADLVQNANDLSTPEVIAQLEEAGISHVFVGTRGGPLLPERLEDVHYVELFRYGPTRIYKFVPSLP